jgi:pimeloyl-ACP methyl ester carboxylesterase
LDSLDSLRHDAKKPVYSAILLDILSKIAILLGRAFLLILTLLLCLPVALLPIGTLVPTWMWALLAVADLLFIVAIFWLKWSRGAVLSSLFGVLLVTAVAVVVSQVYAGTPPITGPDGKPLPGSIATLEQVELNGSQQWISIRGVNAENPVLLNLGMGGPGGGGFATRTLFEPLEEHFVVVSWDEPGTGKSIHAVPMQSLTPERFIEDAHALTLLLRERFHQDKIYVYGTSWTSILGVWLVQRYPELYHAYIGNAQMVNTTGNDVMGYELALDYLTEKGDSAALAALRSNGPPPYNGPGMLGRYVAYLDVLNDYMDAPRYVIVVPIVPVFAPEYGWVDKVNHTLGLMDSFAVVYPQLADLDFMTQATRFEVPVYIFTGKNDVNAMASLVEEWYNRLEAPHKELTWLEGGHGLGAENLGQFVNVMVNNVLAQTQPVP